MTQTEDPGFEQRQQAEDVKESKKVKSPDDQGGESLPETTKVKTGTEDENE